MIAKGVLACTATITGITGAGAVSAYIWFPDSWLYFLTVMTTALVVGVAVGVWAGSR